MNHTAPAAALATLLIAGCAGPGGETVAPAQFRSSCAAFAGRTVPASKIGLPSGDARIAAAALVPAAPQKVSGNTVAPATPELCQLTGTIAPLDAAAKPIGFQLNLPVEWNGKALQYGGGGFNGLPITGLAPLRDANPDDPLPIARGYATFGTDSGHRASDYPPGEPGAFALNDEMLANFAYASYKKVRDVAVELARLAYGRVPSKVYYFGGSEGGREGLTMAQRFPVDYDGIVSVVPVINWTGLFHAFVRNTVPQFGDWIDAGKTPLIAKAVAQACDALDGLSDGVINHYQGCQSRVDLSVLRCPGGRDDGPACLSDAELTVLRTAATPYRFSFPLANGVTTYPGWLWGHEDALDGPVPSLQRWLTGTRAPLAPPDATSNATQWIYGSNWIRYAIARDGSFDVRGYDPDYYRARVQQTSALMDSTDPDLSAFFSRGGKLIIRENGADRAQSPAMGFAYHDAVVERLGKEAVERSMRVYVSPASTHSGVSRTVGGTTPVPTMVDLLDPLDRWVTTGRAPADAIVQSAKQPTPPFDTIATRPMCRYPAYPRYVGRSPTQASSYACTVGTP